MAPLTARQVRSRYLVVLALRWLPTGLLIPVTTLLMLERGLTLAEVGLVVAAQGIVVLALELPTGGLADALGRRPVLVAAGLLAVVATGLLAVAASTPAFLAVWLVWGASRALDSGPLDAWFVDATLATDPDARLEPGLGAGGSAVGIALATGCLASGGLVALGPVGGISALTLPVLCAIALEAAHLVGVAALVREPRRAAGAAALRASLALVPVAIGSALGLLRRSRVLLALVAVELSWGFGMVAFETLTPVRLAETTGSTETAAALLGPVGAAAWLVSAGGAALSPVLAGRIGAAPAAALLRVAQGGSVIVMGLVAGPVGVVFAYLACYAVHGASNPVHQALLHRQVDGRHRTSVLSLNSMVAHPAGSLGSIVLTSIAGTVSTGMAIVVGGIVLAAAAPLYLPAWLATRPAAGLPGVSGDPGSAG